MRKKKLFSVFLALVMLVSLVHGTAYAGNASPGADAGQPQAWSVPYVQAAPAAGDEGFVWDEASKTLTITASTGDYTTGDYSKKPYQSYASQAEKLVIDGDENTVIGTYAFYSFSKLQSVEIKACGDIGKNAFASCFNMKSMTITKCGDIAGLALYNSLETLKIGECGDIGDGVNPIVSGTMSKLKDLTIEKCGDIQKNAFGRFSGLESVTIINGGVIGERAFYGLSKIAEVTLGTVGDIGKDAFGSCSALEVLTIGTCGDIANGAFSPSQSGGNNGVKTVTIGTCGDISANAFANMANFSRRGEIVTLTIGECGAIGSGAFSNMPNLEEVSIGKCASISSQAFAFDSALSKVEIADCESIGDTAFMSAGAPIETLVLENCAIAETAFYMVKIDTLVLDNISEIGDSAFQSSTIKNITLSNIDSMGKGAFAGVKELAALTIENVERIEEGTFEIYNTEEGNSVETLILKNVDYIGSYAFYSFNSLKKVYIDQSCGYVGAHAFTGCDSLTGEDAIVIADTTRLGYSDVLVNQPSIHDRVKAILADKFGLDDLSTPIGSISPEGWTSVKTGEANSAENIGDTQLIKEAKWNDAKKTIADVQLKAYYTANKQMDFIIVADCSNSMAGFGSSDAMNSNFYNMQSKMMDVAQELLSSEELDTRVAFSTFGETEGAVSPFFEKGEAAEAEDYIWNDIVNYESNTNYSVGLAGALELVKENAGRNTTVIFISDGQPYYPGEIPSHYYGVKEANDIRALGVQIISVLQQVPADTLPSSQENMEKIADKIFSSTDLAGFSDAINGAIEYAYATYTLTDTVDPAFALDEDSIQASAGDVTIGTDENGNTTITWVINGLPFEEHTLSFQQTLKADERGIHPTGELDTNEGKAVLKDGTRQVNAVETPVLGRGVSLTVEKKWEGDKEENRPDSIDIILTRDGEDFETLQLTAAENWTHTWILDEAYEWSVKEVPVEGYTTSADNNGLVWTITNTYIPDEPAEPSEPSEPEDTTPATGGSSRLLLWAVVMVVALGGMGGTFLAIRKKKAR